MTKKELEQYYHLKREIAMNERKLRKLRAEAQYPASPILSDEPRGPHNNDSRVERLGAEIVDLEAIVAADQIKRIHELAKLERWISDIPDSLTRQIFYYRHVECMRWVDVAIHVGGGNTTESVRKIHDRYLKKS